MFKPYEDMQIPDEKIVLDRIKAVMDMRDMRLSVFKDALGWPMPKISKVFSGARGIKYSELAQMTSVLGYSLEPFIQEDFDLVKYERQIPPMDLSDCFKSYFNAYPSDINELDKMVMEEIPFSMKHIIHADYRQYTVRHNTFECWDPSSNTVVDRLSFYAYVSIVPKNLRTEKGDTLEMGYFIGNNRKNVVLTIRYRSPEHLGEGNTLEKRQYYKGFVKNADIKIFDKNFKEEKDKEVFFGSLNKTEICSIVYDFKKINTENNLEKDLNSMFEVYKQLLRETGNSSELYNWERKIWEKPCLSYHNQGPLVSGSEQIDAETREVQGYKCSADPAHTTFEDINGKQYVDVIRIVPLKDQPDFSANLDCVDNSACVCPLCAAQIVYGCDRAREDVLVKLYYNNRDRLLDAGIDISLTDLLNKYRR